MSQPSPEKMLSDGQILERAHERTLQELPDRLIGLLDGLGQNTACNITRRDRCLFRS